MDRNEVPNQRNPEDALLNLYDENIFDCYGPKDTNAEDILQEEAMDDTGDHRVEDANSDKGRPHDK